MKRLCLLLVITVLFALPAHGEMHGMEMTTPGEGYDPAMKMGSMERMAEYMGSCLENADRIGLSADQVKQLTPLHREMRKRQIRFQADLKLAEMDHMDIMEVKDFDLERASASVRKIAELKTAHYLEMLKSMKTVRGIFNDEQYRKFRALKMQEKMSPRGMPPFQ